MKEYIEIGRMYTKSSIEGERIFMNFDPTVLYKINGKWKTYNPLSKKEAGINFPSL